MFTSALRMDERVPCLVGRTRGRTDSKCKQYLSPNVLKARPIKHARIARIIITGSHLHAQKDRLVDAAGWDECIRLICDKESLIVPITHKHIRAHVLNSPVQGHNPM